MLEAHIVSPRGSMYYYAEDAVPYDLQVIGQHLRHAIVDVNAEEVRLEIIVDDAILEPRLVTWLRRISASGVQVQPFFPKMPAEMPASPGRADRNAAYDTVVPAGPFRWVSDAGASSPC